MTVPISKCLTYGLGRTRAATVAVLVGLCGFVLIGCAPAQSSEPVESADANVAQAPDDTDPMADSKTEATHRLRDTIFAGGVTTPLPDDTLQALSDGICRQLAAGTDRSTIIENLRSVTHNGATNRPGQLQDVATVDSAAPTNADDTDRMAKALVDAAQATYC